MSSYLLTIDDRPPVRVRRAIEQILDEMRHHIAEGAGSVRLELDGGTLVAAIYLHRRAPRRNWRRAW